MSANNRKKFFSQFLGKTLKSKIKVDQYEILAEDVVWDKESRRPISRTLSLGRVIFVFGLAGLVLGVVILRTAILQVAEGDKWRFAAEGNRVREIVIEARRGEIYDRNTTVLAKNIPSERLLMVPGDFPVKDISSVAEKLAPIVSLPAGELLDRLKKIFEPKGSEISYDPIVLMEQIDHQSALRITENSDNFPGLMVEQIGLRNYPLGETAAHSIGYIGKISEAEWRGLPKVPEESGYQKSDFIGKTGLEKFYERELRGTSGLRQVEVDALGRVRKIISETPAVAGKDLVLSLDARLQQTALNALKQSLQKFGVKAGSVAAVDPRDGSVLILASVPSYDDNKFIAGLTTEDKNQLFNNKEQPLIFRAVSGIYPSGSTIKPLMATAGLAEGVITPKTTVLSVGGIRIGQSFFPDWKAGGHGIVDVKRAIAESINTFFYMVGGGYQDFKGLGIDRVDSYMSLFGLGEKTGLDLPSEASGLVPTPSWKRTVKKEKWYIGDTYHLSIGQGDLLVTPLQMAQVTATIANGGTVYQPRLVMGYIDPRTNSVVNAENNASRKLKISSSVFETVREGMRQTITSGSGRALSNESFEVAGKTGTAEAPTGNPHGWFTAFAPYNNPEIAIAVMVENGGEGYQSALPVARAVLEEYFRIKSESTGMGQ